MRFFILWLAVLLVMSASAQAEKPYAFLCDPTLLSDPQTLEHTKQDLILFLNQDADFDPALTCLETHYASFLQAFAKRPAEDKFVSWSERRVFADMQWMRDSVIRAWHEQLAFSNPLMSGYEEAVTRTQYAIPVNYLMSFIADNPDIPVDMLKRLIPYSDITLEDHSAYQTFILDTARRAVQMDQPDKIALATDILTYHLAKNIILLEEGDVTLAQTIQGLEQIYQQQGLDPVLQTSLSATRSQLQAGIPHKDMLLQPGDLLLESDVHDLGHVLQALIAVPSLYGHVSVIMREEQEGWPVYYRAEIQGRFKRSTLTHTIGNVTVLRPEPSIPITLSEPARSVKTRFDAGFLLEEYGTVTTQRLYCSELIHYIYTNAGQAPQVSPFPQDRQQLPPPSSVTLQDNFERMGLTIGAPILTTDTLLQNDLFRVIGMLYPTLITPDVTARDHYDIQSVYLRFHEDIITYMASRPLANISVLEAFWLRVQATLSGLIGSFDFDDVHFPNAQSQQTFIKFFALMQAMHETVESEKQDRMDAYERTILPELDLFFTP